MGLVIVMIGLLVVGYMLYRVNTITETAHNEIIQRLIELKQKR